MKKSRTLVTTTVVEYDDAGSERLTLDQLLTIEDHLIARATRHPVYPFTSRVMAEDDPRLVLHIGGPDPYDLVIKTFKDLVDLVNLP